MMKDEKKQKNKFFSPTLPQVKIQPCAQSRSRTLILALIVAILGIGLYSNTFSHGYVLDDVGVINKNDIVRQGIHAIPEIFSTSYRKGDYSLKDGLYRPLSLAMFAIEWNFFPDKPTVSHVMNVVLYGITGFCRASSESGNF